MLHLIQWSLLLRLDSEFGQQRQFMADASHELRTPVTVIRSAADVALDREDTPVRELRRALGIVNNEGRRMTRIVDDLFLLARADAGQQPIRISPFFLEELIASVGVSGQLLGRARGVTVSAPPADEAPIIGDESLIGRLLLNLVHNAIDHTPSGGTVCLRMDKRNGCALPDGTTRPGDWYRILVEDNGHGVDPNVLERLFERFVRSSPPHLETGDIVSDGAGLGLAIARWIAVAHDGHVVLQSTGPSGSCFAVWLHVAPGVTSL